MDMVIPYAALGTKPPHDDVETRLRNGGAFRFGTSTETRVHYEAYAHGALHAAFARGIPLGRRGDACPVDDDGQVVTWEEFLARVAPLDSALRIPDSNVAVRLTDFLLFGALREQKPPMAGELDRRTIEDQKGEPHRPILLAFLAPPGRWGEWVETLRLCWAGRRDFSDAVEVRGFEDHHAFLEAMPSAPPGRRTVVLADAKTVEKRSYWRRMYVGPATWPSVETFLVGAMPERLPYWFLEAARPTRWFPPENPLASVVHELSQLWMGDPYANALEGASRVTDDVDAACALGRAAYHLFRTPPHAVDPFRDSIRAWVLECLVARLERLFRDEPAPVSPPSAPRA